MCIYCGTNKYRKIYENHIGPIPKENNGRTYDIHHIDGNRSNNHPNNLKAVTVQEHYDIHYAQQDWYACLRLAESMKLSSNEMSELARKNNLKRVENGTHPFLGSSINETRVKNGTHPLTGNKNPVHKLIKNGTFHLMKRSDGTSLSSDRIKAGTHNLLGGEQQRKVNKKRLENKTHNFIKPWTCPTCGKNGVGTGNFSRWHGNNCKKID